MKFMAKDKSPCSNRTLNSVLCAMTAALHFVLILSLQSYLANTESFLYGLRLLIVDGVVSGLILLTLVNYANVVSKHWNASVRNRG